LKFIIFDLLYIDGETFLGKPYRERREKLEKIIEKDDILMMSEQKVAETSKDIDVAFDEALSRGLEGIMAKKIDGIYRAGARDWNWIKFKRSYSASLEDTIDALVMGYYYGRGKRTAFGIGAFLIGIYDKKQDMFMTVSKIGTGLTDDEWKELYERANTLKAREKPPLYDVDNMLEPDVWIEPEIIVEIRADEITRSPVHTAGRVLKPSKSGSAFDVDIPGFALRFPRLEHFRDDKKPEDITNLSEIEDMYKLQKK
jgi:DNA ligase 1